MICSSPPSEVVKEKEPGLSNGDCSISEFLVAL